VRIGVLSNLRAGGPRIREVLEVLRAHPEVRHVETDDADAVPDVLRWLEGDGLDLLVVNGGDGTLQRTLTELLRPGRPRPLPRLAPLRGGRTNMIGIDLGADRDPARGFAALLRRAGDGTLAAATLLRPVLRIEIGPERSVQHGMFLGPGVIHRAIEVVHRVLPNGRVRGVFGAGVATALFVARSALLGDDRGIVAPDKLEIHLDGEVLPHAEYRVVLATTLSRLFLRLRPFWGEGDAPVRFTAIAAHAPGIAREVPGILVGRPSARARENPGLVSRRVRVAELSLQCGFTIDGEQFAPSAGRHLRVTAEAPIPFVRA
jgi:hypothetical protein